MYTKYTLKNGLSITVNKIWLKKLLIAESKSKKAIIQELLIKKNKIKSNDFKIPHAQIVRNTLIVCYKAKLEKRYWVTQFGKDELFVKEELTKKNYLIKQNEFQDSLKQSKYVLVPEYILKIEDPKNYVRVTITKKIQAKSLKCPSKNTRGVKQIENLAKKLAQNKILPAILRPNHFLFKKNKLFLVDNSIGFPPINRNKIVLLQLIEENKLQFNWHCTKNILLFETQVARLSPSMRKKIDLIRITNLVQEFRDGEKTSQDFEMLVKNKAQKLFSEYYPKKARNKRSLFNKKHIISLLGTTTLQSIIK